MSKPSGKQEEKGCSGGGSTDVEQQLETIKVALKTVHIQNERLMNYQEVSYRWHHQHHANLKRIISGINRLAEIIQEQTGTSTFRIEAEENPELFSDNSLLKHSELTPALSSNRTGSEHAPRPQSRQGMASQQSSSSCRTIARSSVPETPHISKPTPGIASPIPSTSVRTLDVDLVPETPGLAVISSIDEPQQHEDEENFNDVVLSYKENIHAEYLQEMLRSVTSSKFRQLSEEGFQIILPVIEHWLESPVDQSLALVYLWEGSAMFPLLFSRQRNRGLLRKCLKVLDSPAAQAEVPLSKSELKELRDFIEENLLDAAYVTPWDRH
ncbi:GLOBIN domain-containing protein [Balamuthia mandrillaris]